MTSAAAIEAQATLYSIKPSDILSKYQGESERLIQCVFIHAGMADRAIIFFDGRFT